MSEKTVLVSVSGHVQGVGFRAFTGAEARRFGVKGYVRNLSGGGVEAVLSGPDAAVEKVIRRLREGPAGADVQNVHEIPHKGDVPAGFEIRPTR